MRAHLIARPTEEEAWDEVRLGWEKVPQYVLENGVFDRRGGDSVGAQRQAAYQEVRTRYEDLVIAPNIWAGIAYLGDMPTVGIVGSYEQVAERLDDLVRIGADALVLSGHPHLEETFRIGEEVLPLFLGSDARTVATTRLAEPATA